MHNCSFASSVLFAVLLHGTIAAAQPQNLARDRARGPYKIGFEHMRAEAWEEAAKAFEGAIAIDPTFELAHYMLGRARMPQKKYLEAIEAFSKARSLYLADAGRQFANAQEAQRYRRDRITEIDQLISELRSMPQTLAVQEQIRQLQERKRQMQEREERGNNMSLETMVPAYISLSLGSAYFRSANLAEAEKYYREAISADPRSGEAHNNLAVVFMETGRYAEAEKSIKEAERAGFKVQPALKAEIARRKSGTQL